MRRRDLLTLIGASAFSWPRRARAQQKAMPVIGLLVSGPSQGAARQLDGFRRGLGEEGFVEGRNVAIETRWAEGDYTRLPAMAADLVGRRVAVIAAMAFPAASAAKAATATVPIVFYSGVDPVDRGLVKSFAHPGGNLTGIGTFITALNQKRVELLRELVPNAASLGLLVNPRNPATASQVMETKEAMHAVGLRLVVANAGSAEGLAPALAALAGRVDGLILGGDPSFGSQRDRVVALAAQYRLPMISNDREYVDRGGLISYGDSIIDIWRQVGTYTGKVLHGAKPADLPVMRPGRFELVINLKTAKALGLAVPPILLAQATDVVE